MAELYGDAEDNVIEGTPDDDLIRGRGGDDVLDGGSGVDVFYGGVGNDTIYVDMADDAAYGEDGDDRIVVVGGSADPENPLALAGQAGIDTLDLSEIQVFTAIELSSPFLQDLNSGVVTVSGMENFIAGNFGSEVTGTNVANKLIGGAGVDTFFGREGNDILNGKGGADWMEGGFGDDTYYVDAVGDVTVEKFADAGGIDTVIASIDVTLASHIENLAMGASALRGIGNDLNNTITGNRLDNVLSGKGGADLMIGGAGNDTYYIDDLGDAARETSSADGIDTIIASISFSIGANIDNLSLGATATNGAGNRLANEIIGNGRDNILTGNKGADTLTGNRGSDTFDYNAVADSTLTAFDRITDLTDADRIDLSGIDANAALAGDQAFSIVDASTNIAGQMTVAYSASTDLTTFLMDVTGDGVADMKIVANGDHHDYGAFVF